MQIIFQQVRHHKGCVMYYSLKGQYSILNGDKSNEGAYSED